MGLLATIYDLVHAIRVWRDLKRRGLPWGGGLLRRFGLDLGDDPDGWVVAVAQVIDWLQDGRASWTDLSEPSFRTVPLRCRYIIRRLRLRPGAARFRLYRAPLSQELLLLRHPA